MTLDTLKVVVPPITLRQYLERLDHRGEVYLFMAKPCENSVGLELDRDGSLDTVEIILNDDGTWQMTAHLVVGKKNV